MLYMFYVLQKYRCTKIVHLFVWTKNEHIIVCYFVKIKIIASGASHRIA